VTVHGETMPAAAVLQRNRANTGQRLYGRAWRLAALVGIYLLVTLAFPHPAAVDAAGRRVTGIFLATIGAS
jgi:hypothetical protein